MKKNLIIVLLVLVLFFLISGCTEIKEKETNGNENETGGQIANPASVYCEEQGGNLEIREGEGGQYGMCVLPDGTECDEWAYYSGECPEEEVQGQETGGTEESAGEQKITNPLNVPRVNSAAHMRITENYKTLEKEYPALSYLGAFAMLVMYDNNSFDYADVVAYSGVGTNAKSDADTGLGNGYNEKSIIQAAENLGYGYFVGVEFGGDINSVTVDFKQSASKIDYFVDREEAFDILKQVIDSGKPVVVHLDAYYAIDDFRKVSDMWVKSWEKVHSSHFMTVTGYDDDYVYINDPTDHDLTIKNMKVPNNNFLSAWSNGNSVKDGAQLGPYWMLYLVEDSKKTRKSVNEVILWNWAISEGAASIIRQASKGGYAELGVGRNEFGKFLIKNGNREAGVLYQKAANIYFTEPDSFTDIAEKEEEARRLLK